MNNPNHGKQALKMNSKNGERFESEKETERDYQGLEKYQFMMFEGKKSWTVFNK